MAGYLNVILINLSLKINLFYLLNHSYLIILKIIKLSLPAKAGGDNQLRKFVVLFDNEGESLFEFKSEREMARHFNVNPKIIRIAKGKYLHYTLVTKLELFRKEIFVFNSNTLELITKLKSLTIAMSYAKVSFYTLKFLLETKKPHNGKIYSFSDKPFEN